MKTLVSAKRSKFNPWLVAGYAAIAVPALALALLYFYGWSVMLSQHPDESGGLQFAAALFTILATVALGIAAFIGIVLFFFEDKHLDVYYWWRRKVDNYGKVED